MVHSYLWHTGEISVADAPPVSGERDRSRRICGKTAVAEWSTGSLTDDGWFRKCGGCKREACG